MCKSIAESKTRSSNKLLFSNNKVLKRTITKTKMSKQKTVPNKKVDIEEIEKSVSREQLDQYLKEIHQAFKKLNSKNPSAANRQQEYILEKTCEKCENIHCDDLLLLCDICDDAYHTFCLDPPLAALPPEEEEWICPVCEAQKAEKELKEKQEKEAKLGLGKKSPHSVHNRRQSKLEEHFHIREPDARECFKCKEMICEKPTPMKEETKGGRMPKPSKIKIKEICIKCQNYFHLDCFNTKKTAILCHICEESVREIMPKSEHKIQSFFGVKTLKRELCSSHKKAEAKELEMDRRHDSPDERREEIKVKRTYKKGSKKVTYQRKTFKFRLPKMSQDPKKVLNQKMSLAFALLSKNIAFDDDLCYSNPSCPMTSNDCALEPNLQKLDKTNIEVFKQFKEMTRNGNYPPVLVEENKEQGFIVRADDDIPKLTLIAEYVGEVDFARNRVFDKNDSIMDLLRTPHSSTSLVICPEKRGNLARFLSGINNYDKDAKRSKQNVKSVRYNIEGKARVFLYSGKAIKKGEILYYDYNEGCFDEYPTEDFV